MEKLKILVIGGGGREHAIVWKIAQSPLAGEIFIAPGNAGTASLGQNVPIAAENIPELLKFAQEHAINLTVVGPEAPLAAGVVDVFQEAGLKIFGPSYEAAQLEASKAFSKAFMLETNIPTAAYASFTDYGSARQYVEDFARPVVVKASGLAAGKGVTVCHKVDEAQAALKEMMLDNAFGAAGATAILEECLTGREVSALAFCDGKTVVMMPPARDHKRIFDGDQGGNTGGMGAFSPVPDVDAALMEEIRQRVLQPAIDGMLARGTPYVGVLYAGLMLPPDGIRNLEFNCRLGDPEAQVLLPLLETDLVEIILACIDGKLDQLDVRWKDSACATVVISSPGYPGSYPKGLPITGLATASDAIVFHAGTTHENDQVITAGGRVLAVSAVGENLDTALNIAYAGVKQIHFDGMHYRTDIGRT